MNQPAVSNKMKSEMWKLTEAETTLRDLYLTLACGFITHPDVLKLEINRSANFITLTPTAHAEDGAKLVGRGGANFNAMRTILQFAANRLNVRLHLSRVRDVPGTRMPDFQPSFQAGDWPVAEILQMGQAAANALFVGPALVEFEHNGKKSTLKIEVGADEKFVIPPVTLEESLYAVFSAIGKNNGRMIGVRMKASLNENLCDDPEKNQKL